MQKNLTQLRLNFFLNRRAEIVNSFSPTKKVDFYLDIDEKNKLFRIGADLFEYSNLLSFQLLEDSCDVDGGLGRVESICNSLKLKVTLKNAHVDIAYITFIMNNTKKNSFAYKSAQKNAQLCISAFENIAYQVRLSDEDARRAAPQSAEPQPRNTAPQTAAAIDEFEKLYQLLHSGLITQEEFDAKKKQLLGL